MYLHIGNGKSVKKEDIVGIFDLDTATVSKITRGFVNKMQKDGRLEYYDADLPRTFVLVENSDGAKLRLSRISTQGLKQRADGKITEE
jgi:hypothetical protein